MVAIGVIAWLGGNFPMRLLKVIGGGVFFVGAAKIASPYVHRGEKRSSLA